MRTFRLLGMALLAIVMCVNFTACSSDDDEKEETGTNIVGTWKYTSSEDGTGSFTFKSNGGLVWDDGEETTSNHTYQLNGKDLKIIFNDNDDYTLGTFTIAGNKATYKYYWYDYATNKKGDKECSMSLTKQ